MMNTILRLTFLLLLLIAYTRTGWSQPVNDDCTGALPVLYANDEASVVTTAGDTRGGTASTEPTNVCSGSWYTDDIWFTFTSPSSIPANGIIVRAWFNPDDNPSDVPAIGMAVYNSCDVGETPVGCFSSDNPAEDRLELINGCLLPDHDYVIRVWSTGNTTATEGTLRVGVYANPDNGGALWTETFGGGIEANGWSTEGSCGDVDSNANAGWKYLPEGLLDKGAYIFAGAAIASPTICDGAVGVDSDYDDNAGIEGNQGNGPCPSPAQHILVSPQIDATSWTAAGLTLTWTQAIRQYLSTFFFSYRFKDGDNDWGAWNDVEINQEFELNADFVADNTQRHFMPGAAGHDFIQIRFVYNADYYMWGIDDVKIVETECTNMRVQENFFAIAPWANIPSNQVYPFAALSDIYNSGACAQTNVKLNYIVRDSTSGTELFNETLQYGTIGPDSLAENKPFPTLITVPKNISSTYEGIYTVSQDMADFDSTDNVIRYSFYTGGDEFALETGFTRSVAVATGIYDAGAPLSYAFGNYFRPVEDADVAAIVWGVSNTTDMIDKTVNLYLLEWTDTNGDQIAENSERSFIGFAEYTFDGSEGDNAILTSTLDNFEEPGSPVIMQGGKQYFAIIEYVATSATDPQFFLLASDDRNYGAQVLAMDSLFTLGVVNERIYSAVLGFSPDGIIANIDYEVTDFDVNDNRVFFGHDIIPLVRVLTTTSNTRDDLASDNLVTVYPNPATDQLQVKLDFTKPYHNVRLRLIDNLGRLALEKEINQQVTEHSTLLQVSGLASGQYRLQVVTSDGQRTIPVVLIR